MNNAKRAWRKRIGSLESWGYVVMITVWVQKLTAGYAYLFGW